MTYSSSLDRLVAWWRFLIRCRRPHRMWISTFRHSHILRNALNGCHSCTSGCRLGGQLARTGKTLDYQVLDPAEPDRKPRPLALQPAVLVPERQFGAPRFRTDASIVSTPGRSVIMVSQMEWEGHLGYRSYVPLRMADLRVNWDRNESLRGSLSSPKSLSRCSPQRRSTAPRWPPNQIIGDCLPTQALRLAKCPSCCVALLAVSGLQPVCDVRREQLGLQIIFVWRVLGAEWWRQPLATM
jgi:hypothetical protein